MTKQSDCIQRLVEAGISFDDATALRRAAMTLHRWHELECGNDNGYSSFVLTRGHKETRHGQHNGGHGAHYVFVHDDNGKPYMEIHPHNSTCVMYEAVPDRETGARKRVAKILASYPGLSCYVQGDPRGAALYILRPGDVPEGKDVDGYYSRGIAVYK